MRCVKFLQYGIKPKITKMLNGIGTNTSGTEPGKCKVIVFFLVYTIISQTGNSMLQEQVHVMVPVYSLENV